MPTPAPSRTPESTVTKPPKEPTATVPLETVEAGETLRAIGPLCQDGGGAIGISLSPYNDWYAGGCGQDAVISRHDHSEAWYIRFSDYYRSENGYRDGYLLPSHWTQDGRYLFVKSILQIDGQLYYLSGMGMLRIDMSTGAVSEYVAMQDVASRFYSFSFSFDDRYLGYVLEAEHPLTVRVLDLRTGEVDSYRMPEGFEGAGYLVWSPNHEMIAFSGRTSEGVFTVGVIDTATGAISTADTPENHWLTPVEWTDPAIIELGELRESTTWIYNLVSGVIAKVE